MNLQFAGLIILAAASVSCVPAPGEASIRGTYSLGSGGALCGKDQLQTLLVYQAVEKGDKAGAIGSVASGEVDYLEPGTTVHAYAEDRGLAAVSVTAGTSLGKQCWMPTKMLGVREKAE